jgi:hypothetical protein
MTTEISVPVPEELIEDPECDFELKDYFQDLVQEEFGPALDTDIWELGERAVALECEVDNVEVQGDSNIVYFSVTFDAYYGCKDQNYSGSDERHVAGNPRRRQLGVLGVRSTRAQKHVGRVLALHARG